MSNKALKVSNSHQYVTKAHIYEAKRRVFEAQKDREKSKVALQNLWHSNCTRLDYYIQVKFLD